MTQSKCSKCKETKDLTLFSLKVVTKRPYSWCKACVSAASQLWKKKNPKKHVEYCKQWRLDNPDKWKDVRYQYEYGISLQDYNCFYRAQNGCCAICKTSQEELKRTLAVDHSHRTGKVRGLLCDSCNKGIGNLHDSIDRLASAIVYLKDAE